MCFTARSRAESIWAALKHWEVFLRQATKLFLFAPRHKMGRVAQKKKQRTLPLLLMSFYSPNLKSAWCKYLFAINAFRSVPQNAFISGMARAKWSHWKSLSLTAGKGMKRRYRVNARPPLWTCGAIIKVEMQAEMLLSPPRCGYFSKEKSKMYWICLLDLKNCYCCPVYQWLVFHCCFFAEADWKSNRSWKGGFSLFTAVDK